MKRRGERATRWGEGWLLAAVLAFALVFTLAFLQQNAPAQIQADQIHATAILDERLRRMEMLDLNKLSAEELETLPGIGETLARRIVELRTQKGGFTSVEELLEVEGIGTGKLEKIRDMIYVAEFT